MPVADRSELRRLPIAGPRHEVRAARMEGAPLRAIVRMRHGPRDRRESLAAPRAHPQPATQLIGQLIDALIRRRDAAPPQHLDRLRARPAAVDLLVEHDRLDDLIAHAVNRAEGGHRLLEDQRDLGAADRPHLLAVGLELREVDGGTPRPAVRGGAPEPDLPRDDPTRTVDDTQDGARRDALA